ncbi:hypothetical protein [Mitsuaria sp. 7]|uniref:hypothetical protein n=1 Tax=Mitsuaria sp. 7 TaxID=1658665 RepID=UPI0007DDD309|nr:hypothetical protein [Mitsuaria sp. 7]ANH68130.1 hypothetical protein ABE85_12090 [Mitsuaria sp. 7]
MTTTSQRRRPAARKTKAGDATAVPAATDVVVDPVIEPVADAAAAPTDAAPRPARKRTPRAKATDVAPEAAAPVEPTAVADAPAGDDAATATAIAAAIVIEADADAPAKKRSSRKRGAAPKAAVVEATEAAVDLVEVDEFAEAPVPPAESVIAVDEDSVDSVPARKGRRNPKPEPVVEEVPPEPPRFTLGPREDDGVFGDYELRDGETGGTFHVRLLGRKTWRCDCADYRDQGACEHGGELLSLFDGHQHAALDAGWPAREAEVWLVPGDERELQWVCGREVPQRLRDQAGLDDQRRRRAEGGHAWLQQVLSDARALGVVMRVDAPVWPQLACGRDAQARVSRLETLMADGAAMRALLRDELPSHAWEAALFAVCAGRALISDDLGLGQRGAAIAAIQLWATLFGVKPAVVIAPEAAHAAWQRDLKRWLGDDAKSVTVTATPPAKPQPALLIVDGIELMGADRLAALRALPAAQLLLIAHEEPLGDARLGEWVDWLDDMRRGPLSDLRVLPDDAGKKVRRDALEPVLLSRRKRELEEQMPAALLTPLWLDGAGSSGSSLPAAPLKQLRQLVERWTALRFLSSADQQQLLEALALLPPTSRQALAAKAEAVLALRREWIQATVPAAARLVICARSETLLDSLAMSPQLRRLPPQRLRAGDTGAVREAVLSAWRGAEAGVLLASDDALGSLDEGELAGDRLALVHADLPWQPAVLARRVEATCGGDACGVPSALLLIEDSLDTAVLRAQRDGVVFPDWLDSAPAWLDVAQLDALMAVLPTLLEGL